MNAPENTPAAYPINLAHEVLLKSDDAMCVDEVARAIIGKKPTKADIKPVAKLLKELADLGLIEMEPRAGGVPFYRLIVASESLPTKTYPPETLRAMIEEHEAEKAGELSFLAPENITPINAAHGVLQKAKDALCVAEVAKAMDASKSTAGKQLKELYGLGLIESDGTPFYRLIADPKAIAPNAAAEMAEPLNFATSPEVQYLAPEDYEMPPADPALLASANRMLCDRLEAKDAELLAQAKVVIDLRNRLDALTQQWEADTGRITADLRAALESRSQVINEADRLRAELATERQAREALQEQDGVDVKDAAVGYLVRVTKRKPRYVTRPERARDAALAAVRAGAGRAEVLAVVPVGVARRGAEWRGSNPMGKGD